MCSPSIDTKLIPNLQTRLEDGLLRVEGEAKVADPSSESLPELIQVRSILPEEQGLVKEPGFGPDAQTCIHFRIDMFPCARNMCKAVGCHPAIVQIPGLEMNQTIVSSPAGGKFPANGACATKAYRRTACRSNRSNTCAQASLQSVTGILRSAQMQQGYSRTGTRDFYLRTVHPNPNRLIRYYPHHTVVKPEMETMETLVVFDFDWSLIDCNSDTWVVEKLGAMERMKSFRDTLPWTQLMDRMMTELHNDGRTLEDIDNCLRMAPIEQEMVTSVKFAAELGCELQIVSDANSHFIKKILESHGIQQYFSQVHTNPGHVDASGALRVLPFHPKDTPHGCELCPPNMCKGLILDSIRLGSSETLKKRAVYIGDGGGDYCPSLRLVQGDHVLARHGFPLSRRLTTNMDLVAATVHEWTSARDVERLFRELLLP